jgi:hypothetical protein
MQIRAFEEGDADEVVALWRLCGLTRPWNDPHRDIARKLEVQRELFDEDRRQILVLRWRQCKTICRRATTCPTAPHGPGRNCCIRC